MWVVHQSCHYNLDGNVEITSGQWELTDQACGDATNMGKKVILNVTVKD